jgi:hypothetical protein
MNRHCLAEERSLAMHRRVAELVRRDPRVVDDARARLRRWTTSGAVSPGYAERWWEVLDGPLDLLLALLVSQDERARAMRQVSPFAGALTARERWAIWREVGAEAEARRDSR